MDVDRLASVTRVANLPRRVALSAYGVVRFLDSVQGAFEDIEGALAARQYGVAAFQARYVVLVCLSVRSLAREGELDLVDESVSFDFFAGLDDAEVSSALALAAEGSDLSGDATAWLERMRAFVQDTERLLEYDSPLPVLRSPEGSFGLVSVMRRWTAILEGYGWPSLLGAEYFHTPGGRGDDPRGG